MASRRNFIRNSAAAAAAFALPQFNSKISIAAINDAVAKRHHLSPDQFSSDEDFWAMIREAYSVSPAIINLNNGGVSPQTVHVQEMQYKYIQMSNEAPSYYMWRILDQGREPLRQKLADAAGCSAEELAINRN
ncbi:MAG: twin-arginine translocation signal domain-containing protein, partial [Chitinophagales bacterium]|nr:twin-arginine translocation signal domain-containing protein [Chitinophagales bacterium]